MKTSAHIKENERNLTAVCEPYGALVALFKVRIP